MRIAVVSPFVDRQHGTERALAELLDRLVREYQCEIHLYSQRVADISLTPEAARQEPCTAGIFWHKVPRIPGPHIAQFCFWFYLNRLWRSFSSRKFDLILSPGINCSDADVVVVHALFSRLQEVSREGQSSHTAGFLRTIHRKLYYSLLAKLEKKMYQDPTTALAAVSQRTADLLSQYFQREDVRVIPYGVDGEKFSVSARLERRPASRKLRNYTDEDFVLLLIGNDWGNKGLPALLKAMGDLQLKSLRLLTVGNDVPGPFRELAEKLGIAAQCAWERGQSDVMDFYAAADLYVSPSREDSFGLPVAEAMLSQLPVITSSFAGVSGLVHDGVDGFVLPDPADVESLGKLIRMLSEQKELRDRVGTAAAASMREWTWDRHAALVWDLLNDAVRTRKAS